MGYGVFATAFLPKGTITWVLDPLDQRLDAASVERLGRPYADLIDKYTYVDRKGTHILCWDFARFMNHSCIANTMSAGLDFELALRDIQPGEEVTSDYAALNLDSAFQCLCRAPDCRGTVKPGDFERFAVDWDRRVEDAFKAIPRVEQVLWGWVEEKAEVEQVLRDLAPIPSILDHRYRAAHVNGFPAREDVPLTG